MSAAPVRPLEERLVSACIGGCSCMTKTPEIQYHDELCHYRLFRETVSCLSDAATRIAALESENARLKANAEAERENMKEMQRDAREAISEAVAEARYQERTGDPYGTY